MEMEASLVGPRTSNPYHPSNIYDLAPKSVQTITEKLAFTDKIQKNLIVTIHHPVTVTIVQKGDTRLNMKSVNLIQPERGANRKII